MAALRLSARRTLQGRDLADAGVPKSPAVKGAKLPGELPDLCGWLEKKGDGIIKRYRRRWCELHGRFLYYTAEQGRATAGFPRFCSDVSGTSGPSGASFSGDTPPTTVPAAPDVLGRIDLAGTSVEPADAGEDGKPHALEIRGAHLPRTYTLAADAPGERDDWVRKLREASARFQGATPAEPEDWVDAGSIAGTQQNLTVDCTTCSGTAADGQRERVEMPNGDAEFAGWLEKKGEGLIKRYRKRWCELHGRHLYYGATQRPPGEQCEALGRIDLAGAVVEGTELADRMHALQIRGPRLPRTYVLAAESDEERADWVRRLAKVAQRCETDLAAMDDWLEGFTPQATQRVGLSDFVVEGVVGRGTFGKVCKVRPRGRLPEDSVDEPNPEWYAMKVVRKASLPSLRHARMMMEEKVILQTMKHPYVVRLYWAFQTSTKLYLVLTFLGGGDLKHHLTGEKRFSEPRARFYTAEVMLALDHLHSLGIVYRDLKPQNIVLDSDGHAVLTDLGLATDVGERDGRAYTFCGTPQYVAPELLNGKGYAKAVDFWSLGVMVYEFLVGATPFQGGDSLQQMFVAIMEESVRFPQCVTRPGRDFISALLERDPAKRLCSLAAAKPFKFMKGVQWAEMRARKVTPPWKPPKDSIAEQAAKVRSHTEACAEVGGSQQDRQGSAPPRADIAGEFDGFSYTEPGKMIAPSDDI
eukprot:TRINITY_DN755_c0_g2_i2.p2 TRINITY_DN755_c0_g2~~TRINITY_DN755_c0_g2_i2.p2  ORF type:complete len:764 (+),score=255.40 TRINITY_DN755_c0_g2_i2:203-2293(+)